MPRGLPLKWEVSFLLIQAELASPVGLIQALGGDADGFAWWRVALNFGCHCPAFTVWRDLYERWTASDWPLASAAPS